MPSTIFTLAAGIALLLVDVAHAQEPPPEAGVRRTAAGDYLTDARGLTLYTYQADPPAGAGSACIDKCAVQWPPLLASSDATPRGAWTLTHRPDGRSQWSYKGRPLYTFAKDDRPMAQYGVGRSKLWRVAFDPLPTPPGIGVRATLRGEVLIDLKGHTLYFRSDETAVGGVACTDRCLDSWRPVRAPVMANGLGDWTVIHRREGFQQWAFQGHLLYSYGGDEQPGEFAGDGAQSVWRAMVVGAAPGKPDFVTVQNSDFGRMLADADGKTLYAFIADLEKVKRESCNDVCFAAHWKPLAASPDAATVDQWSVVTHADGSRQWAFRGDLVYTHTRDVRIGDAGGFPFATGVSANGVSFQPLIQASLIEPAE